MGANGVCCARVLEGGQDWGEPGLEGTQGCSSPSASSLSPFKAWLPPPPLLGHGVGGWGQDPAVIQPWRRQDLARVGGALVGVGGSGMDVEPGPFTLWLVFQE